MDQFRRALMLVLTASLLSSCGDGGGSDLFSWSGEWDVSFEPATGNCFCNEAGSFVNLPALDVSESGRNIHATFCEGARCIVRLYNFDGTATDPSTSTPSFVTTGSFPACGVDAGTLPSATLSFVQESALDENRALVSLDIAGVREGVSCSSHFEGLASR